MTPQGTDTRFGSFEPQAPGLKGQGSRVKGHQISICPPNSKE